MTGDDQPMPRARRGKMRDTFIGHETRDGAPMGVLLDGALYGLDGQPPPAPMGGWGDLSWLIRPWRSGS